MTTRDVGFWSGLWLAATVLSSPICAQDPGEWRERFAAGEEARQADDVHAYAREMAAAAEAMPEGLLNRPFVQYHAARSAALAGRPDEAIAWLTTAWDEDIEALMISFAPHDPAFDAIEETPAFGELMSRASSMRLSVRRLGDGLHLVQGAGSNVVVMLGEDGVLLVDTGYGPALPALRSAIAAVGGGPVTHLIVTHPHEDHMGATPSLGSGAVVYAHPGTTSAMSEPYVFMEGVTVPPKPAEALPDVEISRDTTVVFDGRRIRIVPTVAHTTGDLSVHFPEARVAHLGDTYLAANPMMYPGTADPDAFLDRLDALLASMDPETVVIGGHEEPATPAAVRRQIETTRAAMAWVREAIDEGLSLEETAERGSDRFPPQWLGLFYRLFTEDR